MKRKICVGSILFFLVAFNNIFAFQGEGYREANSVKKFFPQSVPRSEERRVGKECVSTC